MNVQGKSLTRTIDKEDLRQKLQAAVSAVNRGELLGSLSRITSGGRSYSIKEARKILNIPDGPILFAEI